MTAPDSISPKDSAILQDLKKQEEIGEQGFAVFYKGDQQTGAKLIKHAFDLSASDVRSLKNSYLRQNAEALLNEMNKAIRNYMKQPSDENLSALKSEVENYKSFLGKFS
jgi:hypothetical protein